jgi:hypothetical protein
MRIQAFREYAKSDCLKKPIKSQHFSLTVIYGNDADFEI